jgi:Ca-activated chloride channel family protein
LVKEGICVSTIGLGLGYNEDLMTRLAQKSDGNTYFAESSYDLTRIFNAELGDVLSVVARRIVITIEFPEGVRPIRFVGRDGTIHGQRAELSLNQIYGGQEKFALVEVEVNSASAGAEREVARATLSYEDTLTQKSSTLKATAGVRFAASESEVIASANRQVQTDYAVNATAMAKDAAISLVDSGRREDAARVLQQRNAELKKLADTYRNAAVADITAKNEKEADRLQSQGLDNAARKSYRAENMQTINQQSSWSKE